MQETLRAEETRHVVTGALSSPTSPGPVPSASTGNGEFVMMAKKNSHLDDPFALSPFYTEAEILLYILISETLVLSKHWIKVQ